jgi:hypothetical protein
MQMSLRCRTTVRAVMSSVGIVIGICGGSGGAAPSSSTTAAAAVQPHRRLLQPLHRPHRPDRPVKFGGSRVRHRQHHVGSARIVVLVFSWIATGVYALIVWSMYKSMVKNFDMTIAAVAVARSE